MRSYKEFVQDVMESESDKKLGGVDFAATYQLAKDVSDYCRFYDGQKGSPKWFGVQDVLASRLAYANTNFDSTYLKQMQRVTELGEGELMHRFTNDYKQRLMFPEVMSLVASNTETLAEKVALKEMSKEDYERFLQQEYESEVMEDVQEDMGDFKREAYSRILEEEGFSEDTPYDMLPAYVTSRLEEAGVQRDDFLHENEENLSFAEKFAKMEKDSGIPDRIYGDGSVGGRIYGESSGRPDRNGSLVSEYGDNQDDGYNFDDF